MNLDTPEVPKIYEPGPELVLKLLSEIMANVGAIEKTSKNTHQGFNFRSIDQYYAALQPLFVEHNVLCTPKVLDMTTTAHEGSGRVVFRTVLKVEYTFYAVANGSSVSVVGVGEGVDSGDKAANKAMSFALKYALTQLFMIPTHDQTDGDYHSPTIEKKTGNGFAKNDRDPSKGFSFV